uniref:CXXC-type zinc finger protein 1 n=1 Tax=Arcella intermedia TaxID=1963864 RepID=A0A6B2L5R7_9EUKA
MDCVGITPSKLNRSKGYTCSRCESAHRPLKIKLKSDVTPAQPQKSKERCINCKKKFARMGSAYCTHDCGIAYAAEQLKSIKADQNQRKEALIEKEIAEKRKTVLEMIEKDKLSGLPISLPEQEDLKILEDVNKEREELKKAQAALAREKTKIKSAMAKARATKTSEAARGAGRGKRSGTLDLIDCVGCGKPVAYSTYSRHHVSCFAKLELAEVSGTRPSESEDGSQIVHCDYYDRSNFSYCKKLKASCVRHSGLNSYRSKKKEEVQICGCPLSNNEFCTLSRKTCNKHVDWENIKNASILLLELTHMQNEKQLKFEEKIAGKRMARRRRLIPDDKAAAIPQ